MKTLLPVDANVEDWDYDWMNEADKVVFRGYHFGLDLEDFGFFESLIFDLCRRYRNSYRYVSGLAEDHKTLNH